MELDESFRLGKTRVIRSGALDLLDGWLLLTKFQESIAVAHVSVLDGPGSYRVVDDPSGFPLLLILDKDRVLRCFHNVCRHRAYPLVSTRRKGRAALLSCHYHGWTYNLRGQLIKAPKFDGVEGFEQDQIGLYPVHAEVDTSSGLVLVNVSGRASGASDDTVTVDIGQPEKGQFHHWEVEGRFNWKVAGKLILAING